MATGSMSGSLNILKVDKTGRSNLVKRTKMHPVSIDMVLSLLLKPDSLPSNPINLASMTSSQLCCHKCFEFNFKAKARTYMSYSAVFGTLIGTFCLDIMSQIIFSEKGSEVVIASKADGTIYFLHNKSSEFDDLELQGFTVMNDPVLALAWDPKASKGGPVFWLWNSSITPPPLYSVLRFSNSLCRVLKLEITCSLNSAYCRKALNGRILQGTVNCTSWCRWHGER